MAGCTDNVNSVGNKLIGSNEKFIIADTTLGAVSDTVFNVSYPNGAGATCVIGKTNDVEAKTWLRFLTGALNDSIRTCTIDSVELRLTVSYTWNAPAAPGAFEIHEGLSGWTSAGLTRDSLASLQFGGAVLGQITDSLTLGRQLHILLDTATVRTWITTGLDAAVQPKFEFVIFAKPGTTPGVFGYYTSAGSSTNYPTLIVRYHKNGVRDSVYAVTSEDTFIASAAPTTQPELEVRAGVSTWSKMRFDVTSIPQSSIVNNATLELTQKSSATQLGVGTADTLYAYIAKKGTTPQSIDSTYRILGRRKDNTTSVDPVYVFTITPYIQFLITPGTPYDGIVLQAGSNIASVDRMTFYSSKDPDATKRPRLLITTSKK
jgi:hypothetical protein